jgi:hypothetical protein
MATHPGMLLAYTEDGSVVATLDYLVQYDENRSPIGLVNFARHEEAGGENTDIWSHVQYLNDVDQGTVKGSKVWPEWLGARAHEFRVELEGPPGRKRIKALVHRDSGHRRERAAIEAEVASRIEAAGDKPADIRDLVGGPDRPMHLDDTGRSAPRPVRARKNLPLLVKNRGSDQLA